MTNSNDCFEVFCVKLCEIASNECPSVSNECQISVKACQISAKSVPKRGQGVSTDLEHIYYHSIILNCVSMLINSFL